MPSLQPKVQEDNNHGGGRSPSPHLFPGVSWEPLGASAPPRGPDAITGHITPIFNGFLFVVFIPQIKTWYMNSVQHDFKKVMKYYKLGVSFFSSKIVPKPQTAHKRYK